jgi:hypothetical protein
MEGEKAEPLWGDPSYRRIPKTATENDIEVNHLHVNTDWQPPEISPIVKLNLDEIKRLGAEARKKK